MMIMQNHSFGFLIVRFYDVKKADSMVGFLSCFRVYIEISSRTKACPD